jgi:hypothetical protein
MNVSIHTLYRTSGRKCHHMRQWWGVVSRQLQIVMLLTRQPGLEDDWQRQVSE